MWFTHYLTATEDTMVSMAWVVFAFMVGSFIGAVLIGLMTINARSDDPLAEPPSESLADDSDLELV